MKQTVLKLLLFLILALGLMGGSCLISQEAIKYKIPPKEILDLADAPSTPYLSISPDKKTLMLFESPSLKPIRELAQPELKLAGLRINPRTNGRSRGYNFYRVRFRSLKGKKEIPLRGVPAGLLVGNLEWSPDSTQVAFTVNLDKSIELWVADAKTGQARSIPGAVLNGIFYGSYHWLADSRHILFRATIKERGPAPGKDLVPIGPNVQVNLGKKAPVRTYQDLLKNKHDEKLFTYYATSQLQIVDVQDNTSKSIGNSGIISSFEVSPDNKYILVQTITPPFSYLVPYYRFPAKVEIWNMAGELVKSIVSIPLADDIPKGFMAVRKGPRSFTWREDAPATLYWVEALDGGDPAKKSEFRDQIFALPAPFSGPKMAGPRLKLRYRGINWGTGRVAVVYDDWWNNRKERTLLFHPDSLQTEPEILFDRSWEDRYNDPGRFVMTQNKRGRSLLLMEQGKYLFLMGRGASPQGNRPFIDRFNLRTKRSTRLWRSKAPYYEYVVSVLNLKKRQVLTRRESKNIQPNYFIRYLKDNKIKQITHFPHPYPALKGVSKQFIKFQRPDGVTLTGDLYLPAGYKKSDGPLPAFMWAYPREFKKRSAAGQVSGSPHTFLRLRPTSPILWVTQGYAVLNNASMPIVGEGKTEPNDTFVKQLVANAQAAIDKLVAMGVADRQRVAIGGHSYGAFMTANLLSHSRLFAAGIARSGAYNRTLTPFGFQAEERTFWEAPQIYFAMSPFMHAPKVKDPLLLIHGEMDNNSGTFPIQSKRYYHALKGHGATVRLVMLPFESHGYRSRESVLHMLWETHQWLEKYVKTKK
jgi:dipeptidyl aminopeptidase/acylaminoacyl peptidase